MDPGDDARQGDSDLERVAEREPALRDRRRERLTEVLDDQRDMTSIANDLTDIDDAIATQRAQQIILALDAPGGLDCDELARGLLDHDGLTVAGAHRALDERPRARVQGLNDAVAGERVSHHR